MEKEVREKLDALFEQRASKERAATEAAKLKAENEVAYLQRFREIREAVIKPAMTAMAEYLKTKGIDCEIDVGGENSQTRGRHGEVSIALVMYSGERNFHKYQNPNFRVIASSISQRAFFHESTISPGRGGHSGGAGDAALDEITEALIQRKIMKVVSEAFG